LGKKIHILKDDFTPEYFALGISTSESIFHLIMHLNDAFGIALRLAEPLSIITTKEEICFPCGLHADEDILQIRLIKQKINGKIILKKYPMMDYLLVISGENAISVFGKIQSKIRSLPNISLSTAIPSKNLKSITAYLF
jgi:hypothetical protein